MPFLLCFPFDASLPFTFTFTFSGSYIPINKLLDGAPSPSPALGAHSSVPALATVPLRKRPRRIFAEWTNDHIAI